MEIDEIESWYEEEKQRIFDEYMQELEETGNREKGKREYEKQLDKIMVRYKKLMKSAIDKKKKMDIKKVLTTWNFKKLMKPVKKKEEKN